MMTILKLTASNKIREIEMTEDEFRMFTAGWAHEEISKAYMKIPLSQRWVIHHMRESKEIYSKAWIMFYERFPELKYQQGLKINAKSWMKRYFEETT